MRKGSSPQELERLDAALALLQRKGLRKTSPRESVLEFLTREHGPFTNEEIHRAVRKDGYDLTTVYRCVSAFEKVGLVRRCDFGDGIARYEYQGHPDQHHHHVICMRCRKTDNLEACRLPRFETRVKELGYTDVRHSLEFFGICRSCRG